MGCLVNWFLSRRAVPYLRAREPVQGTLILKRLPRADTPRPRRLDGRLPITLECASRIGDIMKDVDPTVKPQVSHSFYMQGFRGRPLSIRPMG